MKQRAFFLLAFCLAPLSAHAAEDEWLGFSRVLSIAQSVLAAALASPAGDSRGTDSAVDSIFAGRNGEANALAGDLFGDMPAEVRSQFASVARTALALSRRQAQQAEAASAGAGERTAIEARRDLAGMGHSYHDASQFLDAVRRDDRLAARLFLAGRGLEAQVLERARALASSAGMKALLAGGAAVN